jgi:hypothetical protein
MAANAVPIRFIRNSFRPKASSKASSKALLWKGKTSTPNPICKYPEQITLRHAIKLQYLASLTGKIRKQRPVTASSAMY